MTTIGGHTAVSAANGIGTSPARPDGTRKVRREFAYSSDLRHEDMLWGATLRSPHPHARITGVDISAAVAVPGVHAVLTHDDVPGLNRYGLEHPDQPVLAADVVRYRGEPVAVVAADHPETAQRAVKLIGVGYDVLDPVTDAEDVVHGDAAALHPGGNVVRHVPIRRGRPARLSRSTAELHLDGGKLASTADGVLADLVDVLGEVQFDETVEWRHRPNEALDPETGQGNAHVQYGFAAHVQYGFAAHVQYGFAAHRAVVDVDTELGLVKVVSLDCRCEAPCCGSRGPCCRFRGSCCGSAGVWCPARGTTSGIVGTRVDNTGSGADNMVTRMRNTVP
ncbi:Aldehyde oxidase and xanthine dehydrogenase, a/b hammerhead domain [Prauserella alba]|uniref:Aldehyde oxidase/xanthine dehydrogenase a/b hammerhead domain-containing protein n=1 Tax=Prauserella alba TaxID=176898 RepID=A0ABN1VBP7_9PSEU|nr:Aldehyde oxidase and xanthine dehydrogenase, a/b hammerhead domain [Prauserella alba]